MESSSVPVYEARLMQLPKRSLVHQLALSQGILESLVAPFLVVDLNFSILFLNRALADLQQSEQVPEYYLDQGVGTLLHHCSALDALLLRCFETRKPVVDPALTVENCKGLRHTLQAFLSPVFGMRNELLGASILFQPRNMDPSQEATAGGEAAAPQARQHLQQFESTSKMLVMIAGEDGSFTNTDASLGRMLETNALSLDDFLPPGHASLVAQCLQTGQRATGLLRRVAGRVYSWNYNPLLAMNVVQVSVTDVTAAEQAPDSSTEESLHDPLTGLPNRTLFMVLLTQTLKRSARLSGRQFAILYLDLDRFKLVNDSLGHDVGDALLRGISDRLLGVLRSCDTLARLSGDEFIILLDTVEDVAGAMHAAERILMTLSKPFAIRSHELFVTASVGIVVDNGQYTNPEDLVRDADTAMFRAKAQGKGSCMVFDQDMHQSARRRLEIEMDLKRTLDRDEFRVFYQPIVNLRTLALQGFEALVRWFHPVRGMVSPVDFIPLAEETGMIVHIGASVLYESCRTVSDWQVAYPQAQDLMLSVNLSVRQFRSPTLLDDIQQILAWSEFPPQLLKLEITESGIMENAEASLNLLHALKEMQICLSIDDFGTGYSSLSYLHRFPFDYLKVDQSFIKLMHESGENMKIVRTIIALAHDMDKQVVAEGIETMEQLASLRALGCEFGQGFLFSRPLSADDMENLLQRGLDWSHLLPEIEALQQQMPRGRA